MNRVGIVAWLIGWIVSPAPSALGAGAGTRPPSVLETVRELEWPVTYNETKIPLGELIEKVAQDTGVKLAASKEVADEPVAVVVKEFPARELLEQLADLLDYRWSRRTTGVGRRVPGVGGTGETNDITASSRPTPDTRHPTPVFEIYQDLASKQREEALRQAYLAGVEQEFHDELDRYVQMAALSQEQINEICDARDRQLQEMQKLSPEEQQRRDRSPEGQEQLRRFFAAARLRSPINRALAGMLGRLSPRQWDALREGYPLVFSTTPRPGEFPLPADTARRLREARSSRVPPGPNGFSNPPEIEAQVQRQERLAEERWAAATGFRVELDPQPDLFRRSDTRALVVHALAMGGSGGQTVLTDGGPGAGLLLRAGRGASPRIAVEDDLHRSAALEADPVVGVKRSFKPETKSRFDPSDPRSRPWWRFWELAGELARVYDVAFISDSYGRIVNGITQPSSAPTPLFVWLDRFARTENREWDRRGRLIRLRSRTWYLDRPREIPLRLIRRWKTICGDQGALPLEEYVRIVTTLTEPQLEGLNSLHGEEGLPPDMSFVQSAAGALRLYGALSPAQQQALWQGKVLPLAQMTPAQRDLFAAGIAAAVKNGHPPQPAALNEAAWSAGSFALATERLTIHITHRRGEMAGYGIEDAPPPRAVAQGEAGAAVRRQPSAPAPRARPLAADAPRQSRHAVMRVTFLLQTGFGVGPRPSILAAPRR